MLLDVGLDNESCEGLRLASVDVVLEEVAGVLLKLLD